MVPMVAFPYLGELLSILAALFWAVGVVFFKLAGDRIPPLSLNFFKNMLAVALLLPTMVVMGEPFVPDLPAYQWLLMAGSGVVGIAVADTMFFYSLEKLGAGLTAVVDTSYTPMMLGLSFIYLGEDLAPKNIAGGALIMGALLVGSLTRPQEGRTRADVVKGTTIGLLGILLMTVGIMMIKPFLDEVPLMWSTTVRVAAGAIGLLPIVLLHPKRRAILSHLVPSASWRASVPAALFGTYLAMIAWIGGMKYIDAHRSALLNQLSTIFIFLLATVFLKEPITRRRLLAIGLAAAGAFLVAY